MKRKSFFIRSAFAESVIRPVIYADRRHFVDNKNSVSVGKIINFFRIGILEGLSSKGK